MCLSWERFYGGVFGFYGVVSRVGYLVDDFRLVGKGDLTRFKMCYKRLVFDIYRCIRGGLI